MNFKKILCIFASTALIAAMLVGCGSSSETTDTATTESLEETTTSVTEAETAVESVADTESEVTEESTEATVIDESVYDKFDVTDYIGDVEYSSEFMDIDNDGIPEMIVNWNDAGEDTCYIFKADESGEVAPLVCGAGQNLTNIEGTPYFYAFYTFSMGKQVYLASIVDGQQLCNVFIAEPDEYSNACSISDSVEANSAVFCDRATAEAKMVELVGEDEKNIIMAEFDALTY